MNIHSIIAEVEIKCRKSGVSVHDLCDAAELNRATYQRWKNGSIDPLANVNSLLAACERLTGKTIKLGKGA